MTGSATAAVATALALLAVAVPAPPAGLGAQERADTRFERVMPDRWSGPSISTPTHDAGSATAASITARADAIGATTPGRQVDHAEPRFGPVFAVTVIGSIVGVIGGANVGAAASESSEPYLAMLVGALAGSVAGGTVTAAGATGNFGLSLAGSAAGTLTGFLVAVGGGWVVFPFVHAAVTAATVTR